MPWERLLGLLLPRVEAARQYVLAFGSPFIVPKGT